MGSPEELKSSGNDPVQNFLRKIDDFPKEDVPKVAKDLADNGFKNVASIKLLVKEEVHFEKIVRVGHRLVIKEYFKNQMEKPEEGKSNVMNYYGNQGRLAQANGDVQMGDTHNYNQGKVETKVHTMNIKDGNGIVGTQNDNRTVASDDKEKKEEENDDDEEEENLNLR